MRLRHSTLRADEASSHDNGFPCGAPVATNFDPDNVTFAQALANVVFRESAELGSFLYRDQTLQLIC